MKLYLGLFLIWQVSRQILANVNGVRNVATFGQEPVVLGGVFSGFTEQFIPGLSIFKVIFDSDSTTWMASTFRNPHRATFNFFHAFTIH